MGRLLRIFATVIVIGVGLIVLEGLLTGQNVGPLTFLVGFAAAALGIDPSGVPLLVRALTNFFLQITIITIAVTIIIGILNLFSVHARRIASRQRGWLPSIAMLVSAGAVIALWLLDADDTNRMLLETVQVSLESALAALLLFALVYGAARLMARRVTWSAMLFTLVLIIILLGALPLSQAGALAEVRAWLLAVPVSAGARGILMGIALATLVTGLRVLIGQDRSYRE